jgi:hypothetical protein
MVRETRTREVPYTVCRMVPVTQLRTVQYPVVRMVSEQQFRTVCQTVTRMVPEVGVRTVPFTVTREVPVTREVCVPRQVPRTVCFTTTRCVPRTECYQVPVKVRVRMPAPCGKGCCEPKGKGKAESSSDMDEPMDGPAPPSPQGADQPVMDQETFAPDRPQLWQTAVRLPPVTPAGESSTRFAAGIELYRNGRYAEAAESFRTAMDGAPTNASYGYYYAAALYNAGLRSEAATALAQAAAMEKQTGPGHLGRSLERIQGATRVWLETERPTQNY